MPHESLTPEEAARPTFRIDALLWLVVLLTLGTCWVYDRATQPTARTVDALDGAVAVDLPAGWASHETEEGLAVEHPTLEGAPPTLRVTRVATDLEPTERDGAVTRMEEARARDGVGFRVLDVEEPTDAFGGNEATMVWWAMAQDPPGRRPGDAVVPHIVEGVDALVVTPAGEAFHVEAFGVRGAETVEEELRTTLRGVRIIGGRS